MIKSRIIGRLALAATFALVSALQMPAQAQGNSGNAPHWNKARELVNGLLQPASSSDPQRGAKLAALQVQLDALKAQAATQRTGLAAQRSYLQAQPFATVIMAREGQLEAEFDRRASEFEAAVAGWRADATDAKLREVDALLKQYAVARGSAPSLPSQLPWGARKTNPRLPAETRTAWYRILTRDERVQLAQAGLTTIGGIRFTTVPEAGEAPADADLAETAEIALTPAIRAKAQELGRNPVNISNWVRGNVQFAPTWGATQTADATLRSQRGNAIDTATLTIALLRASGIPARYQFGTVDVPAAAAMNWLGGLAQPEAALALLQQGGIAARGLSEAGQIQTIRMEHAWVIAYVNWTPSRGVRDGGAELNPPQHPNPNAPLNAWVPLDSSFKQHQFTSGVDLATVAPFNAAAPSMPRARAPPAPRRRPRTSTRLRWPRTTRSSRPRRSSNWRAWAATPRCRRCWAAWPSPAGCSPCWPAPWRSQQSRPTPRSRH